MTGIVTIMAAAEMAPVGSSNWLAPVKVRQTLIGGSRRMVIYDDMQTSEKIKVYDRGVALTADPKEAYDRMV